ncbi:MAG: VOC family protein [Flavobacteriales bacterium]|nr:VOC family protein [Flavobacteriales bacterium]
MLYASALTTILVVSDLECSKSLYLEVLGARLYREYGGDSAVIEFLGNWLLLVTSGEPTEDKPDTYFSPPSDPNCVSHAFTIRVNNCRESYRILQHHSAEFITPPFDRGAETRCFFRDPDGHLFEISEYRSA